MDGWLTWKGAGRTHGIRQADAGVRGLRKSRLATAGDSSPVPEAGLHSAFDTN